MHSFLVKKEPPLDVLQLYMYILVTDGLPPGVQRDIHPYFPGNENGHLNFLIRAIGRPSFQYHHHPYFKAFIYAALLGDRDHHPILRALNQLIHDLLGIS